MKLAIMQPYLFPYLGYFQLIAAVEKFVFYDDVNFIKNGWINRNRLSLSGDVRYFTIPLSGASSFLKINQIVISNDNLWRKKLSESIRHSYSKAPNFNIVNDIVSEVLFADKCHISELAKQSVMAVSRYLELKTEFVMSSSCYENEYLTGVERVIDICRNERAKQYYNLPGGRELYDEEVFNASGIDLQFIETNLGPYKQLSKEFYSGLSIIDVLMFNDKSAVQEMLFV